MTRTVTQIATRTRVSLVSAATLVATAAAATLGSAASAAVPTNTAPPTISGSDVAGQTLTASPGTWTGTTPISFDYVWQLCDASGGNCARAAGVEGSTHLLGSLAIDKTVRVRVTATNADGARSATSTPTGVVVAAGSTTTTATTTAAPTTTSAPAPTGCAASGGTVPVGDVSLPAQLAIDGTQVTPSGVTYGTRSLTLRVHVSACGGSVQGALVYATAVPYGQFTVPAEQATGADGWASLPFTAQAGFPVSQKQELIVVFVRASAPGKSVIGGISARLLVSFHVSHG